MKAIMKIPYGIPFFGILISIALLLAGASMEDDSLLIAGVILLHLCGWIAGAKFLFSSTGFLGMAIDTSEKAE